MWSCMILHDLTWSYIILHVLKRLWTCYIILHDVASYISLHLHVFVLAQISFNLPFFAPVASGQVNLHYGDLVDSSNLASIMAKVSKQHMMHMGIGQNLPSGKQTVCYWKWWFIVSFPIENGDFP